MWELDYKESWVLKNRCFWIVVLEKTLESPLDCKEIQPVQLKEIRPGCSLEGLMLKLKLQYFGHLMWRPDSFEKTLMLEKIEGRRRRGRHVGWHHRLNGHGFGWTLGIGDGQGGLACCGSWGRKESDTTEWMNWTEYRFRGFPGGSVVKNPPAMQETQVWSLSWEDPLEEGMVTHSNILAWRVPWTEEPSGLQSMGPQRNLPDWSGWAHMHACSAAKRKKRLWI